MMNSAAVIGRQLRQQQTSSRISGPVVPPTQYKGVDADKKFAQFSQLYSHEFYPHPAHRDKGENANRSKQKKKKEPRVQLSWHCFCVALKALSSGLVLLVTGTIMSVVGFFEESLSQQQVLLQNGTTLTNVNTDMKATLHNLTYVGPVIMGLGGIVIVAACVLTFEVRDTLGVKEVKRENCDSPEKTTSTSRDTHTKTVNIPESSSGPPKSFFQNPPPSTHHQSNSEQVNRSATNQTAKNSTDTSKKNVQTHDRGSQTSYAQPSEKSERVPSNSLRAAVSENVPPMIKPSPSTPLKRNTDIFSIDMAFVRIPSPQETQISDPEGCSPDALSRWKSRCSCSGSPTHSMLLALYDFEDSQHTPTHSGARRTGRAPYLSQMPQRNSKILASVESDGLSSSTSTEWEIDNRLLETQQSSHRQYMAHCFDPSPELPTNAYYLRASASCSLYHSNHSSNEGLPKPHQPRQNVTSFDRTCKPSGLLATERSSRVNYPQMRDLPHAPRH